MSIARPFVERLSSKIVISDGCWLWTGSLNRKGYPMVRVDAAREWCLAHRAVYELLVGVIPEGLELDHLCRVRGCVNPAHLEPVTHAENMRRVPPESRPRRPRHYRGAACRYGHQFTPENTYTRPNGVRECRLCMAEYQKRARERRKLADLAAEQETK